MNQEHNFIERFLLRFDYSKKFLFSLIVSFFTAALIAFLLMKSHFDLAGRFPLQIYGVSYFQTLQNLLDKVVEHQFIANTPANSILISNLEAQIEQILYSIEKKNQQIELNYFGADEKVAQDLNFYLDLLNHEWGEIKRSNYHPNSIQKDVSHFQLIESIHYLSEVAIQGFEMLQTVDSGTNHLLRAYVHELPSLQYTISKLLFISKKLFAENEIPPASLIEIETLKYNIQKNRQKIFQNIQEGQSELGLSKTLIQPAGADSSLIKLVDDTTALNKLLESPVFSNANQEEFNNTVFPLGVQIINNNLFLMSNLAAELEKVLTTQLETLNIRRYVGVGFIVFGLVFAFLFYMTRLIRRPVAQLKEAIEEMAKGNLSVRIKVSSNDEVSNMCRAFNNMAEFFEKIMLDAKDLATHLANSTANIWATRQQLENNLQQQEEAIGEIANNTKGISRTVQDFSITLQDVNHAVSLTARLSALGQQSLNEMETVMRQLANASGNIVSTLASLHEKLDNIKSTIGRIITIADQINLLSVNTAIRAGKKDLRNLGFAIIASQISELSERTAWVTLNFEGLLKEIDEAVSNSNGAVNQFSLQIQDQLAEAEKIQELLKKQIALHQTQVDSFQKVNAGMAEQTHRASQISDTIILLTDAAKKTTKSIRYLYLEIEYLYHAAHNLQIMTKNYTENPKSFN